LKGGYALKQAKHILRKLSKNINPEMQDYLTEVLQEGAIKMLALAIEDEVDNMILYE